MKCRVDVAGALQELLESLAADDQLGYQADRRPHRIAAAHPIPHGEAMLGGDAELVHGRCVRRHRHEMIRRRFFTESADDPRARRIGVRLSFQRREGFRADDHQRFRRVDAADQILELGAVHVRDEMRREAAAPFVLQCVAEQKRPQIRTADADVYNMLESLARAPQLLSRTDGGDELGEFPARGAHFRLHGRRTREVRAQGGMQHRALLGGIDRVAAKHRGRAFRQLCRARQIDQQSQGLSGDALARKIEQP